MEKEFQFKMRNAELCVRFLLDREKQKEKEKEVLHRSVLEVIEWERQKWRNPPKNRKEAAARQYLRMHSLLRSR